MIVFLAIYSILKQILRDFLTYLLSFPLFIVKFSLI